MYIPSLCVFTPRMLTYVPFPLLWLTTAVESRVEQSRAEQSPIDNPQKGEECNRSSSCLHTMCNQHTEPWLTTVKEVAEKNVPRLSMVEITYKINIAVFCLGMVDTPIQSWFQKLLRSLGE